MPSKASKHGDWAILYLNPYQINIYAKSSFCNAELILKIHKNKYKVKQIYIPFKKRLNGLSKGTKLKNILQSVSEIITIFINKKKYKL